MGEDMAALKRTFPDIRLLSRDDLLARDRGFLGHRMEGGREVVFYFTLCMSALTDWRARHSGSSREVHLAGLFGSGDGRRRFLQIVEGLAQTPLPASESEPRRRSAWERLRDDEPL